MHERDLELRLARDEEADLVLAFIAQMGFSPRGRATWDGLAMGAMTAWHEDELVGIIPFEPRTLQISSTATAQSLHQTCVAVHRDYRAHGLGTRLQEALALESPHSARLFTVFREDPDSAAYRWYERCGFSRAMAIASFFVDVPTPEQTALPYEIFAAQNPRPSPLPAYSERGQEGIAPGHVHRDLAAWLPMHPYAARYQFFWLESVAGRLLLGVGRMHSTTERADVLFVEGDAVALLRCASDACAKRGWAPLRFPESRNVGEIATLGLPDRWPFDMLMKQIDPTLALDTSIWRYIGVDFA